MPLPMETVPLQSPSLASESVVGSGYTTTLNGLPWISSLFTLTHILCLPPVVGVYVTS